MDREIKFRVWDKDKNAFEEDIVNIYTIKDDLWCNCTTNKVFLQYTWLKDSKGKDIYENDITNNGVVKRFDWLHWDWWGSIHPGRYFDLSYNKDQELQYHTWFDDVIILWNIYENPDLIPKPTNG